MTGEIIELMVEFGVILLAPIVHNYYLWKVKKVDVYVIKQSIKIFSFFYALLAMGIALLFIHPPVHASDSHCYSIQNSDAKNQCLAFVKKQDSYCYSVQEGDAKNPCLALVKRQDSYCYSVRESDDKNLCLAQVKGQDSYCYSIKANDTKQQCLASLK